jgi:hypothetical protein
LASLTDSVEVLAEYVYGQLVANLATFTSTTLDPNTSAPVVPQNVWFGDQEKFPAIPCIVVEPSGAPVTLHPAQYYGENDFTIYIFIYHAQIQDNQLTRMQVGQIADKVRTFVNLDPQQSGLVIHGFVSATDSGFVYRSGTAYRTVRLTYTAKSKTKLR